MQVEFIKQNPLSNRENIEIFVKKRKEEAPNSKGVQYKYTQSVEILKIRKEDIKIYKTNNKEIR